ncbi:hypothetical protein ANN_10796, partial [Periplaneta americana]
LICQQTKFKNVVILCDSKAPIESVDSSDPESSSIQDCQNALQLLQAKHKIVVLQWVPGHCNLFGNEQADALAKKGAKILQTSPKPTPFQAMKLYIKEVAHKIHSHEIAEKTYGKHKRRHLLSIPNRPRRLAVAHFRLATGHDCLAQHLHRFGIYQHPTCTLCDLQKAMNRDHLQRCTALKSLTECARYWEARSLMPLFRESKLLQVIPVSPSHAMKALGGMVVDLDTRMWSAPRSDRLLPPGKDPDVKVKVWGGNKRGIEEEINRKKDRDRNKAETNSKERSEPATAEDIAEVLENRLISQLNEWVPNGEKYIFMQNGAPCLTARRVKTFVASKNIPLLPWPGNSPDFNPIENVWDLVKREMAKNITTRVRLIERLIHVWNHNKRIQEIIQKCIVSMPKRIEAAIKAKGGPIYVRLDLRPAEVSTQPVVAIPAATRRKLLVTCWDSVEKRSCCATIDTIRPGPVLRQASWMGASEYDDDDDDDDDDNDNASEMSQDPTPKVTQHLLLGLMG